MPDVAVDLFPDGRGDYVAEVRVGSGEPWATVSGRSASIHVDSWPEPDTDAQRLLFHAAVPSALGVEPLRRPARLVLVYLYRADRDAILAFDRRITDRYTSYFATIGEQYSGTFDVEGLALPCIGEFSVLDAATPDDWHAYQASVEMPPDVAAIVAECTTLQDRSFERFAVWLSPRPD
jgi:hypothetical protein